MTRVKDDTSWAGIIALACAGVMIITLLTRCHPEPSPPSVRGRTPAIRAIWVTRWDYKKPQDIKTIMANCQTAGFNTVLFQVRGNGTAFYRSRLEPWADELGGRDPGFDPLALACREAHRRGLSIHAWMNVLPGWRGTKPPTNPNQLYHTHPDWFWHDANGQRQPLGWYCSLNPCYPEVRQYLARVAREIVDRYHVDGLHLDYIRFPNERSPAYKGWAKVPDYPRDPRTLGMFRRATGKTPQQDPALWRQWRTDQVTQLVREIRHAVWKANPRVMLGAAVGPDMTKAKVKHFQDTRRWMREGLVDIVFPMNYTKDLGTFKRRRQNWARHAGRIPIVTGIMVDGRSSRDILAQLQLTAGDSYALFAYNSMFDRLDETGQLGIDAQTERRRTLRDAIFPRIRGASPAVALRAR